MTLSNPSFLFIPFILLFVSTPSFLPTPLLLGIPNIIYTIKFLLPNPKISSGADDFPFYNNIQSFHLYRISLHSHIVDRRRIYPPYTFHLVIAIPDTVHRIRIITYAVLGFEGGDFVGRHHCCAWWWWWWWWSTSAIIIIIFGSPQRFHTRSPTAPAAVPVPPSFTSTVLLHIIIIIINSWSLTITTILTTLPPNSKFPTVYARPPRVLLPPSQGQFVQRRIFLQYFFSRLELALFEGNFFEEISIVRFS